MQHDFTILALCFVLPPLAVLLLLLRNKHDRSLYKAHLLPKQYNSLVDALNILMCVLLTLLIWIPGIGLSPDLRVRC